jgi:hypothetical protein
MLEGTVVASRAYNFLPFAKAVKLVISEGGLH